jgi:hypothetical protein
LVAWQCVQRPLDLGGLGVMDLNLLEMCCVSAGCGCRPTRHDHGPPCHSKRIDPTSFSKLRSHVWSEMGTHSSFGKTPGWRGEVCRTLRRTCGQWCLCGSRDAARLHLPFERMHGFGTSLGHTHYRWWSNTSICEEE